MNAEIMLNNAIEQQEVALRMLYALRGFMDGEKAKNAPQQDAFVIGGMLEATLNKEQQSGVKMVSTCNEKQGDIIDMKNVTKRKDGRYVIRYQVNGHRAVAYARTQAQASAKRAQVRKKAIQSNKLRTQYTLESWLNYWMETYKKNFIKYDGYIEIGHILRLVKQKLGPIKLEALTTSQIQEYYNNIPSGRRKEKVILYLNASLKKAVETRVLKYNPCLAVVKEKRVKNVRAPFTIDEQRCILSAIKGMDIEPYIYLYLLTGLRKNELPKDILGALDIENRQFIAINEKQRGLRVEYKRIDLSLACINYIKDNASKFVLDTEKVYRKFATLLKQLNITGTVHTLRHTFATNYYYLGVPDKVIQSWMGHKTLQVTQDIYIGITDKNAKDELIKLYNNLLYKF